MLVQHNVSNNCWLAIHGNVYNLTLYAPDHPGGPEYITDFCGTDATKAYDIEHPLILLDLIPHTLLGMFEIDVTREISPSPAPESAGNAENKITDSTSHPTNVRSSLAPTASPTSLSRTTETVSPTLGATTSKMMTISPTIQLKVPPTISPSTSPNIANKTPAPFQLITAAPSAARINPGTFFSTEAPTISLITTAAVTMMPVHAPTDLPTLRPNPRPSPGPTPELTAIPTPGTNAKPTAKPTKSALDATCLSQEEVFRHATQEDCW